MSAMIAPDAVPVHRAPEILQCGLSCSSAPPFTGSRVAWEELRLTTSRTFVLGLAAVGAAGRRQQLRRSSGRGGFRSFRGPLVQLRAKPSPPAVKASEEPTPSRRKKESWDEDGLDEDLWDNIRAPPPGQINSFAAGASLQQAKIFAATRTMAVAAWDEDVQPKPIFAVSDATGQAAKDLAESAFKQFGDIEKADVRVWPGITTKADVLRVVTEAASLAPDESLAIEQAGAMMVFSLADQSLGSFLVAESGKKGVPCINAMEPVVVALERCFGIKRGSGAAPTKPCSTAFAVSDCAAQVSYGMVVKALQQFPNSGVENITVCPDVRSLQEIDHIVQEAVSENSVITYSFASPGMSRFMRQQCERAKVCYADVFQPLIVAFERYLDYPPVGVPGGHYSQSESALAASLESKWEHRPSE
eukprot:gb/GFBE01069245.1/.p1 GENE.gb/GFBE01069245.1/~~gb/GFBE01069245.1/.p1  ORF type:complete len:417 (+),score=78.21 gb/GFBE01069245.1/:1-1251(+)